MRSAIKFGSRVSQGLGLSEQMLLGWDFFNVHRVLVSNTQRLIYFSYVGGPVFDTRRSSAPPSSPPSPGVPDARPPAGGPSPANH